MTDIIERLRNWCSVVRTRSIPLKDAIPMAQQAADTIEVQAEQIRVLREILPKVMNYTSCDYDSPFRPHFDHVMDQARAALEQTK